MSERNPLLTEDEQKVLEALAEAWRLFLRLPVQHKWDQVEFMHAIHRAQHIVLARPAMRKGKSE
jgi:hypothetical protein